MICKICKKREAIYGTCCHICYVRKHGGIIKGRSYAKKLRNKK